jgi:hypothetical protein
VKLITALAISHALALTADPSGDEILARIECESNRRSEQLMAYSGSRQYTLKNSRFGKQAAVALTMNYRKMEGLRYTMVERSGSDKLIGIIDQVLAAEASASVPPENARYGINSANYRSRFLGTEVAAGRNCYILELTPRARSRYLITGKAWVDASTYAVVRVDGQFSASLSMLVGAPRFTEDFIEVGGYWLPGHVRSVASSFLLGVSVLDVVFSNYEL